jgi:DNA-binding NarL/FixJ family response regulator
MRVLLADDQEHVRSALRLVIDQEPDFKIIGEVTHPDQLLTTIQESQPNLLLLDWNLVPSQKSIFLKTLNTNFPHVYVIVMSSCILSEQEALAAGANSFVSKVEPVERFISSLKNLVALKGIEDEV